MGGGEISEMGDEGLRQGWERSSYIIVPQLLHGLQVDDDKDDGGTGEKE